jgi:hypothetical protein
VLKVKLETELLKDADLKNLKKPLENLKIR